jgi:hypothetical protein
MATTKYTERDIMNAVFDDSTNKLKTTASISGDVNVDSTSVSTDGYIGKASGTNGDFTTAYAGASTITLSSFPAGVSAFTADDIVTVVQIATGGGVTATYSRDDATMSIAANVLTVTGATFAATDTFVVYTNVARIDTRETDVITLDATGSAAINTTTAIAAEFKLLKVVCHFDAAPTTSEDFVITLDSAAGAAYDTVLRSVDPSVGSATDIVYEIGENFKSGDEIVTTFTNTDGNTYGLSVYYQLI